MRMSHGAWGDVDAWANEAMANDSVANDPLTRVERWHRTTAARWSSGTLTKLQ